MISLSYISKALKSNYMKATNEERYIIIKLDIKYYMMIKKEIMII